MPAPHLQSDGHARPQEGRGAVSCACANRLTAGGCLCPRLLSADEARALVRDAALDAAKRIYPDFSEQSQRLMAKALLLRAHLELKDRG